MSKVPLCHEIAHIDYILLLESNYQGGRAMRKSVFGHMRTAKAQIRLRFRAVRSAPSLSVYRIAVGYCRIIRCITKVASRSGSFLARMHICFWARPKWTTNYHISIYNSKTLLDNFCDVLCIQKSQWGALKASNLFVPRFAWTMGMTIMYMKEKMFSRTA